MYRIVKKAGKIILYKMVIHVQIRCFQTFKCK